MRFEDLTGMTFGSLVVVSYEGRSGSNSAWRVRCTCGKEKIVKSTNLKRSQSCGCATKNSTHGATKRREFHPLYHVWSGMIQRCYSKTPKKHYGGRGITVCDRWRYGDGKLVGFECFLMDMGPRPSKSHSVDRINNDGHYCPENCRWATWTQQQRNRSSNNVIEFHGKQMTLTEAIEISGLWPATVNGRIHNGWSIEAALTTPLLRKRRKTA